jgi:hypothetical protein
MSNWTANDISFTEPEDEPSSAVRSAGLVKGQLSRRRQGRRWNEAVVSQFHRSPKIFLQ